MKRMNTRLTPASRVHVGLNCLWRLELSKYALYPTHDVLNHQWLCLTHNVLNL